MRIMTSETLMNRYFTFPLFWAYLLFSPLVVALDMEFGEVAPGVYAYIGETGMRTYDNEGMNANSGFIVTEINVVVVDRLLGVLPFSNATNWLASFEDMERLQPRLIVPGHGVVCDLPKARRETRDYLALLVQHMRQAVADMVDLQAAIDSLDQSAFRHLANYDLLQGGNASRVYLEMERR